MLAVRSACSSRRNSLRLLRFSHAVFAALLVMVLTLVAPTHLMPAAHAAPDACGPQAAALEVTGQAIDEHNARNPIEAPPAIAGPYNQEAAALNAKKDAEIAALLSCVAAQKALNPANIATKALNDNLRRRIGDASARIPAGWQAPSPLPSHPWNRNVTVPRDSPVRPLYDVFRAETPPTLPAGAKLQGQARPNVGDPIPGAPGRTIGRDKFGEPNVAADHIVPLAEILQLPRFAELSPDSMWAVVNAPRNLQWLDRTINLMKGSRSANDMKGLDEQWIAGQTQLQDRLRQMLTDLIAQLADSQPTS